MPVAAAAAAAAAAATAAAAAAAAPPGAARGAWGPPARAGGGPPSAPRAAAAAGLGAGRRRGPEPAGRRGGLLRAFELPDLSAVGRESERLCCSEQQVVLLVDYGLYLATCLTLWYSRVLMPLKLFTTFLHELGHAIAVWLTWNKVHGIEVHADQGGVTKWSTTRLRCSNHFVLPAGYLGSAAWGGAILLCSTNPSATYAITFVLMFFLLVALGYSICAGTGGEGDCTLPALSVGLLVVFGGLLGLCFFTDWQYRYLLLNKVLLLIGVMNTLFSTYDIWTDCVSRTVERSDAYKYAELIGCCCSPVCTGVIWLVLSMLLAVTVLCLALRLMPAEPEFDGTFSSFSMASIVVPAIVFAAAVVFRLAFSRAYGGKMRVGRGLVLADEGSDATSEDSGQDPELEGPLRSREVLATTGHHWAGHASDSGSDSSSDGS